MAGRVWAIVLAGGEGSRLRDLARDAWGEPAPKQFCHFGADRTLLTSTLMRAERLVPHDRIAASVLDSHRRWWARELGGRPTRLVVSQPGSRGTAAGVLAPLLRIQHDDPGARVVILPSDHGVADEAILLRSLERAVQAAERRPDEVILLGFSPDSPDPALGWIVPWGDHDGHTERVAAFVEKPEPREAARLMTADGMWNGMLIVARVATLVGLYQRFLPEIIPATACLARRRQGRFDTRRLERMFHSMPSRDVSRDLLTPAVRHLRVLRVPACGWTDLGTPARLLRWQWSRGCTLPIEAARQA